MSPSHLSKVFIMLLKNICEATVLELAQTLHPGQLCYLRSGWFMQRNVVSSLVPPKFLSIRFLGNQSFDSSSRRHCL
eukprot:4000658-Karenia_brevis.AAC.1